MGVPLKKKKFLKIVNLRNCQINVFYNHFSLYKMFIVSFFAVKIINCIQRIYNNANGFNWKKQNRGWLP